MDEQFLNEIMDPHLLKAQPDEWGINIYNPNPASIGVATTLTPAVIYQAVSKGLDLLVTHHDAWEFMLEQRAESKRLLQEYQISHIWCHEPLDRSDFGTAQALMDEIGCEVIGKITQNCGRVGELPERRTLSDIIKILQIHLDESPCRIHDTGKSIYRIASVPGAGSLVNYLAEALEFDIDLYLTGETSLYLLEYARFHRVSVLIYSHNYTEIFGTLNLASRIADHLGIHEVVRLDESHY